MTTILVLLRWFAERWKWLIGVGGPIFALLTFAGQIIDVIINGVSLVTTTLNSASTTFAPQMSLFAAYMTKANSIFPLTESFTLFRAWLAFYVLCSVFRSLKSMIPGLG